MMSRSARTTRFYPGPGSLEDLEVKIFTSARRYDKGEQRIVVTIRGTVPIYCANGCEHSFHIDERDSEWRGSGIGRITAARDGDEDAADILTRQIVGFAVDSGWMGCPADEIAV